MPSIISIAWDSTAARLRVLTDGYGAGQIADLAIVSGKLADDSIHLDAIPDGLFAAAAGARAKFANGFLVSALVAAGAIGGGLITNQGILSGKYASQSIRTADLGLGQVLSSIIGVAAIGTDHMANAAIVSAKMGAAAIGTDHMANAAIVSAKMGAAAIGTDHVANYAILSGKIGSGGIWLHSIPDAMITEAKLISGISIDIAEQLSEGSYSAKEAISSYALVYLDNDRKVKLATALSGAMPAIGINAGTLVASGGLPLFSYAGRAAAPSSVISGQYKKPVYVGTNSQVTLTPPGSGYIVQTVGIVASDSTLFFIPNPVLVEIA